MTDHEIYTVASTLIQKTTNIYWYLFVPKNVVRGFELIKLV